MRLAVAPVLALLAAACAAGDPETGDVADTEQGLTSAWYAGAFAELVSEGSGDVRRLAIDLPLDASYTDLDDRAQARIATMFTSVYDAIDATLAAPCASSTRDLWTKARSDAFAAGYYLRRFYDTVTQRWLLFGKASRADGKPRGLAYFLVNPQPGRNIVLEVPHKGVDDDTEVEGANLFTAVAARALLVNGSERCASKTRTPCDAGPTGTCNGYYGLSDVAHNDENAFQTLHVGFDRRHKARFFQIHQNTTSRTDGIISDGTTDDTNASSPSHRFYQALKAKLPSASIHGCQDGYGKLCGWNNMQGKMTNTLSTDVCTSPNASTSKTYRFLHFEQDADLARTWTPVRDALLATWGSSTVVYNGGAIGPAQPKAISTTCR